MNAKEMMEQVIQLRAQAAYYQAINEQIETYSDEKLHELAQQASRKADTALRRANNILERLDKLHQQQPTRDTQRRNP